jgi:acetoin utilization protein AcuC
VKLNATSKNVINNKPATISGINRLHLEEKREIYTKLIPEELLNRFAIRPDFRDSYSTRFDVDILPDGTPTIYGAQYRNIDAEIAAKEYGLAPGQIRKGLRLLGPAILTFERFIVDLGHELYFADPLYYHNAVIFEQYGFAYERGRKLMERIDASFSEGGEILPSLDGSNPFRNLQAAKSIRLRSWALHDNVLGETFDKVTMYKWVGKSAQINTCTGCSW